MRADELTFAEVEFGAIPIRGQIAAVRQTLSCFRFVYTG